MEQWIQQFLSELEHVGEDQVRAQLAQKFYSDAEKEAVAREWLKQKGSARAAELERSKAEKEAALARQTARAMTAAEDAAEAVERSARVAAKSNTRASIAIMIAVTALIISVLSLLAHLFK
jgi:hypothetical protein